MRRDLEKLFAEYVNLPLECDGLTRVLSYLLDQNKIHHRVMQGSVKVVDKNFRPHFWIELPDGHIVDYRARMWLGNKPNVPNGVFKPDDFPEAEYDGHITSMRMTEQMFRILTMKWPRMPA